MRGIRAIEREASLHELILMEEAPSIGERDGIRAVDADGRGQPAADFCHRLGLVQIHPADRGRVGETDDQSDAAITGAGTRGAATAAEGPDMCG